MDRHFLIILLVSCIFAISFIGGAIYSIKKNKLTQENYKLILNVNKFIRIICAITLILYIIIDIIYLNKYEPLTIKEWVFDFFSHGGILTVSLWLSSEIATFLYKRKMKLDS